MIKTLVSAIALGLLVALAGCAAPTSGKTKDLQVAPTYTEEEKAAMSTEEKVAAYNDSMSDEKDELVCRREKPTGSHMSKTVCYTREQIDMQRKEAQEALHGSAAGLPVGN
jgi:hypothetical protein